MNYFSVFIFSLLSFCAYGKDFSELHLTPCYKNDLSCIQAWCTKFMHAFADGFGEPFNTEPIDPLSLPERTTPACCDDPPSGYLTYKNIFVRGLKDVIISGMTINDVEGNLYLNLTNNLDFDSDVTYEFENKSFSGTVEFKDAQVNVDVSMDIECRLDDQGVRHLVFGPKHYTCEMAKVKKIQFNPELDDALNNDPVVGAMFKKYHDQIEEKKKNFPCAIVYSAYPHLFELWRKAHRFIPIQDIIKESVGSH